jgi:tRNA-dihydrouridine synthase B
MAEVTDTYYRSLIKELGGVGLVVSEFVSAEGLTRKNDRSHQMLAFNENERPVAIQIYGGDPERMDDAAAIVEAEGVDIVDVNMGCPVPKIAKHNAGCSLMREPAHAASVIAAMTRAVRIPVTVKMRAGWNHDEINAPTLARMVEDAGAAAVAVHGRTAAQSYSGHSDWDLIAKVAESVSIPVFGSGDCVEPAQIIERLRQTAVSGVLVGRGVLRNPWILSQAADLANGGTPRVVTAEDRGRFLLDYIDLLVNEGVDEAEGFRHSALRADQAAAPHVARGRERWVINKVRALAAWYTKGFENGSHLRMAINQCESLAALRDLIEDFFYAAASPRADVTSLASPSSRE